MDSRDALMQKYERYDKALTPEERVKARIYRKWTYGFLFSTWIVAIVFIGVGAKLPPMPSAPNLQTWMGLVGFILSVTSFGCYCIFSGKDTVVRRYTLGRQNTTYSRPIFDDAAVKWGKQKIAIGYFIIAAFVVLVLIIGSLIFM